MTLLLFDTNIYDVLVNDQELCCLLEMGVALNNVTILSTAINDAELNAISDKKSIKYIAIKQKLQKLNVQNVLVQGFITGESQLGSSELLSWQDNNELIKIIGESGQSYRDSLLINTAKLSNARFVTNDENARKRAILHDVQSFNSAELKNYLQFK